MPRALFVFLLLLIGGASPAVAQETEASPKPPAVPVGVAHRPPVDAVIGDTREPTIPHCVPVDQPATDLCAAGESVVFSCTARGEKLLSVCRTPELTRETGTLKYRFGRTEKVELEYPAATGLGTAPFVWNRYTGGTTTILSLSFQNVDTWYTVFMHSYCDPYYGRGPEEEEGPQECGESTGVKVNRGEPIPPVLNCIRPPTTDKLWDLEYLVPNTEESHYSY